MPTAGEVIAQIPSISLALVALAAEVVDRHGHRGEPAWLYRHGPVGVGVISGRCQAVPVTWFQATAGGRPQMPPMPASEVVE